MLMGDNDRIDTHGFISFVFYRYLTLCIGAQPIDLFRLTQLRCLPQQLMCIHDRGRHQFRCFFTRIAEHHPLIPCTHLVLILAEAGTVYPLRNIGGLSMNHT